MFIALSQKKAFKLDATPITAPPDKSSELSAPDRFANG